MSNFTQTYDQNFLLFDLLVGGHHGSYIHHLAEHWCREERLGNLNIIVSPKFFFKHQDIVQLVAAKNIKIVAITPEEEAALNSNGSPIKRIFRAMQEWDLLCKYARLLKATHCIIMYFDTSWLPLVLGKKAPCDFSGIYFRPTLHYSRFADYSPSGSEKLQRWREKLTLTRILRHPQLRTLFCIDPFAPKYIEDKFPSKVKVIPLADPVKINDSLELTKKDLADFQNKLGIESNRKVFLLFGALTERKGVNQLLNAIALLPDKLCQQICFLLVGEGNQELIQTQVARISLTKPVQIISHCEFVPEQDVPKYFQLTDFVLAPYQRHVGMSGILLLAAAAEKPIISSDYGLMGELARRYHLGLAIDSTIPQEIANSIIECLCKSSEQLGDRDLMRKFAQQNSAENFAQGIFQQVLG